MIVLLLVLLTLLAALLPLTIQGKQARLFVRTTGYTIWVYRVGTYIVVYYWGNTAWWNGIYTDSWNHYQLGALILAGTYLLRHRLSRIATALYGIGMGMILDEIDDVIKLFIPGLLPSHFRDSAGDLVVILITYTLFTGIVLSRSGKTPRPETK